MSSQNPSGGTSDADEPISTGRRHLLAEVDVSLAAEVAAAMAGPEVFSQRLHRCALAVVQHLDAAFARVWALDEATQTLELEASAGLYTHLDGAHARVPVGSLKIGLIAAEGQPHLTHSVIGDPRASDQAWAEREGMVAFAGYPLVVGGSLVGVMAVFARHSLSGKDFALLGSVADQIAVGVHHDRLYGHLRAAEARYRSLVENLEAVVWEADLERRTMTFVNRRAQDLLGYPQEQWLEEHGLWAAAVHPDDKEWARRFCAREARHGRDHDLQYRLVAADGRVVWVHDVVTLMRGPAAAPAGLRGVMVEVTDQKAAEHRRAAQHAVTRMLAETPATREAVPDVLRAIVEALGWDVAALWTLEEGLLVCRDTWSSPASPAAVFVEHSRRTPLRRGAGLPGRVWASGEPAWVVDVTLDDTFVRRTVATAAGLRGAFAFPIPLGGHFHGVLECFSRRAQSRDDDLLEAMADLAVGVGQFLGQHQAEDHLRQSVIHLRRRSSQLRRLSEAAATINAAGSPDEILAVTAEAAGQLAGVHVTITTADAGGALTDSGPQLRRSIPMTAPDGAALGCLQLAAADPGQGFNADDAIILAQLAELASGAIHRTRLHQERATMAETLQRSLLPSRLPRIAGMRTATRYLPGSAGLAVGGDWYDLFELPEGRVGMAIGDIPGHGMAAAAAMGQLRSALRASALDGTGPAEVVERMSRFVENFGAIEMATLLYAVFDFTTGTLRFARAGHPPALLLGADGTADYLGMGLSTPLGVPYRQRAEGAAALDGGTLLLYTDGLVERRGRSIEDGLAALTTAAIGAPRDDLERLCDAVLTGLGAEHCDDDVAMVAVSLPADPG